MTETNDQNPEWPAPNESSWHPGAPTWDAPPTVGGVETTSDAGGVGGAAPNGPVPPGATAPPPGAAPTPTFRSWQPGIIALRPLSFGDFLSAPFKAMRFNRGVIIGGPLLFTLASTALSVTSLWLLFNDPALGIINPTTTYPAMRPETVIIGILALISLLLADVLSSTIIAPGLARAVMGERIPLGQAWIQVRRQFGHILVLYLLTGLALSAVIVLAVIPLIIALAVANPAGVVLGVLLVLLVMVPVGFVVTLITGLARPIIVLEQIGTFAALGRAWRLMKGRFWWSVLIVFVTYTLIYIASSILQSGGQMVALMATVISPENQVIALVAFFVVYGLAIVVGSVITYAYMGSVFALMYIDMRMRHEGFDMDLARAAEARASAPRGHR